MELLTSIAQRPEAARLLILGTLEIPRAGPLIAEPRSILLAATAGAVGWES